MRAGMMSIRFSAHRGRLAKRSIRRDTTHSPQAGQVTTMFPKTRTKHKIGRGACVLQLCGMPYPASECGRGWATTTAAAASGQGEGTKRDMLIDRLCAGLNRPRDAS